MAAATPANPLLPAGFLAGPAPQLIIHQVDFAKTALPEYQGLYAVVLDGVLTSDECKTFVAAAEAYAGPAGWERAMINVGGGMQELALDTRNCGRIIWDDTEIVARLWKRIESAVPELHRLDGKTEQRILGLGPGKRGEVWKMTRLNERMRFLKYVGGEYFRPHCDGCYETPDQSERSYVTLHLYLNGAESPMPGARPLKGGATTFHSWGTMLKHMDVLPKTGRVLLFQHRNLLHSGDDVVDGVKFTLRTDLMYTRE